MDTTLFVTYLTISFRINLALNLPLIKLLFNIFRTNVWGFWLYIRFLLHFMQQNYNLANDDCINSENLNKQLRAN